MSNNNPGGLMCQDVGNQSWNILKSELFEKGWTFDDSRLCDIKYLWSNS